MRAAGFHLTFQSIPSAIRRIWRVALACGAIGLVAPSAGAQPKLVLTACRVAGVQEELRCGTYEVFENRQTRRGRKLPLKIVLIPARSPHPSRPW